MKRSEKMLAAGLVTTLALWQGGSLFEKLVVEPVDVNETAIATLREGNTTKELELKRSLAAARKFAEWTKRSLPPDPVDATSLYQNWLYELAARTKLTEVSVSSLTSGRAGDSRTKGEAYHLISAVLKAQATSEKLCDFLYEFRACGLLHRVSKMRLVSKQNTGDPVLDIELTVEGLALKDALPRSTLMPDPALAAVGSDKPAKERKEYDVLVKKNLFVRGYNGPPQAPKPPGSGSPAEDPLQFVRLVASFSNGESFYATMYDPSTNRETNLVIGRDFAVAGMEGKVVSVGIDFVILSVKGETFRLELGENLRQMKKLPATETSG